MPDLIPSYMTFRHSGPEKEDGLPCMGKNFPSGKILRCLTKKSETITWRHKYFWQKRSPCLCDIPGKGFQKQAPVFQHSFSGTDADILCLAGKIPAEPDWKQPYAVHPFDALRISMEH